MPQAIDCPAQNADVSAKENETLDPSDWKNLRTQATTCWTICSITPSTFANARCGSPCQTSCGRGFAAWFRGCRPILPPFMKSSCAMSCPSPQVMFIPALWAGCMAGYAGWHAGGNAGRGTECQSGRPRSGADRGRAPGGPMDTRDLRLSRNGDRLVRYWTSMANLIAVVIARDVALVLRRAAAASPQRGCG